MRCTLHATLALGSTACPALVFADTFFTRPEYSALPAFSVLFAVTRRWRVPIFRASGRRVTAADVIVPVRATVCFAIIVAVVTRRWRVPIFRAPGWLAAAAYGIVPVRAAVRFAIDVATVVGKQIASACLEIGIPHIGFYAQIGRTYRTCLVLADLVLSGIFLFLAAARG